MMAVYGINLKTEAFFFFRDNTSPEPLTKLELDPEVTEIYTENEKLIKPTYNRF
jgi:hypothetical protein